MLLPVATLIFAEARLPGGSVHAQEDGGPEIGALEICGSDFCALNVGLSWFRALVVALIAFFLFACS
jgi:hypothetical protein